MGGAKRASAAALVVLIAGAVVYLHRGDIEAPALRLPWRPASSEAQSLITPPGALPEPFAAWLSSPVPVADGFDFPIGDPDAKGSYTDARSGKKHHGWYVATQFNERYSLGLHPGEDWNGKGGGNSDRGQPVYATATGRVVSARAEGQPWGNVVVMEHVFYENHHKRRLYSLYAHLERIDVEAGEILLRRARLGTIGQDPARSFPTHLHFELRWNGELPPTYWPSSQKKDAAWIAEHYAAPTPFINAHRRLFVPQQEDTLLLVDHETQRLALLRNIELQGLYEIGFGQATGRKRRRGDLKTPKGMYFVVEKHRGEFGGRWADYYGGHWIEVSYPNPWDGRWGKAEGLITGAQLETIEQEWPVRKPTPDKTKLGSGIGFHGWKGEWDDKGPRGLSFGCVVMHNPDIARIYDQVPLGAMVVMF